MAPKYIKKAADGSNQFYCSEEKINPSRGITMPGKRFDVVISRLSRDYDG